jgi:hypothetical protein
LICILLFDFLIGSLVFSPVESLLCLYSSTCTAFFAV